MNQKDLLERERRADEDRHPALENEQHLYLRVYRLIADEIAAGRLSPGDRLPAERVLCRRFGVGRATVRRAIRELTDKGLVESSVGRGTFVTEGPLSEAPNQLVALTEVGVERGLHPSSRVLSARVRPATLDESEQFGIAPGGPIFELERVRLFDGIAFALNHSRIPLVRAPEITSVDFAAASLYATLDAAGVSPVRADYVVWAAPADERTAELLGIRTGDPVLATRTSAQDASRRLVEVTDGIYPAERYRFRGVLTR